MNILFLSTNDNLGGAAIVTLRLAKALRSMGTDARMLVANRGTDLMWVAQTPAMQTKLAKVAERAEIFASNGLNINDLWKVSTGRFSVDICSHPWVNDADVVILNWINQGLLSLRQLKKLLSSGKQILWIMHDLWCATGICHLPGECNRYTMSCGNCPLLHWERNQSDLSHRIWRKKLDLFSDPGIRFIAVSRWQRDAALQGSILRNRQIDILPHAFPVELYHTTPKPQLHSGKLSFLADNRDKQLIVMGAARLDDPIKDLPKAIESLNTLRESHPDTAARCQAVFFGGIRNASQLEALTIPWNYTGPLADEEVRQLYSAASVVLSTSKFETMGATLMEGMAAGAIPVTFGRGGQTDIVVHDENGFIADYGSAESVASCLAQALATPPPFTRAAQHASVASRFSAEAVARRLLMILRS